MVEEVEYLLDYRGDDTGWLMGGDRLTELTLENVRFTGLGRKSQITPPADEPLTVRLRNVMVEYRDGSPETELFTESCRNLIVEKMQ